jgi:hypothetical protein
VAMAMQMDKRRRGHRGSFHTKRRLTDFKRDLAILPFPPTFNRYVKSASPASARSKRD